jgi:hypothetical protein
VHAMYGHTFADRRKAFLNHIKEIYICSEQLTSLLRSEDENRQLAPEENVRDGHDK